VRLGKLPMERRTLFCRRCRELQAGQTRVIIDLMRVLWRVNLMLALKCLSVCLLIYVTTLSQLCRLYNVKWDVCGS
jgi:hypothetical protein